MKVLYCTDLHGISTKYKKLVKIHKNYDLTIIGGDICPQGIRQQKIFVNERLPKLFEEFQTNLIVMFGNDDYRCFYFDFEQVISKYNHVFNPHMREVIINGYSFIGMNYVVDHPFELKDWCRRDKENTSPIISLNQRGKPLKSSKSGFVNIGSLKKYLEQRLSLEQLLDLIPSPSREKAIYLFHHPPKNLGLDKCKVGMREVGSQAITDFIKEKDPYTTLHGHIHESFDVTGRYYGHLTLNSISFQPGQFSDSDYLESNELTFLELDLKDPSKHKLYVE